MTTATAHRPAPLVHFARHYVEMVLGMAVGMVALDPVWMLVWPGLHSVFEAHLLVMATNMAIGMAVPMLLRRHSWRAIAEMSASMYLAFLVVLAPYWAGWIDAGA